ncbi:hypothetical protein CC80DRAFT_500546 [Byssothecium circinans]|uniref:Uncharacterized protein n=1 Tax=Byssothecium circinans TaxID=147558 RepID=A0A6A5UAA4_9PLEO|nr:hypothetical protein CC80DRAFT_500546 [Byssothecium circinans]
MSLSSANKPLGFKRKQEPNGWNYEAVKSFPAAIPNNWWLIPWSKTEPLDIDKDPVGTGRPKFLYHTVEAIDTEYRVHADTDNGETAANDLIQLNNTGKYQMENDKALNAIESQHGVLNVRCRRLQAAIADPRPDAIAFHSRLAYGIHPAMSGYLINNRAEQDASGNEVQVGYGDMYGYLESRYVESLADLFLGKRDLPVWRVGMAREDAVTGLLSFPPVHLSPATRLPRDGLSVMPPTNPAVIRARYFGD